MREFLSLRSQLLIDFEFEGVNPMSRDFLLRNASFARARSATVSFGPSRRTLLSVMLRDVLDERERAKAFPFDFDLGNKRSVPVAECSFRALAGELSRELGREVKWNDEFRTVRRRLAKITGRAVNEHFRVNPSMTLKVMKLLFLMSETRKLRLFDLLESLDPKKAAGLEFRDAYPHKKNEDSTWLISDLKAYLSAELDDERFAVIEGIFSSLYAVVERLSKEVIKRVVATRVGQSDPLTIAICEQLRAIVDGFTFDREIADDVPLDEHLYIHLSGVEFAHYAYISPVLVEKAIPKKVVRPIVRELRGFVNRISPGVLGVMREWDPLISLDDFAIFAHRFSVDLRELVAKATECRIGEGKWAHIVRQTKELLVRVVHFQPGVALADVGSDKASALECVAALCSICHEHRHLTSHPPYWQGQAAPGGSLLESLESRFADQSVFEEHSQIWRLRLDWFVDAFQGNSELNYCLASLKTSLAIKVAEIVRSNSVTTIEKNLAALHECVEQELAAALGSR